MEQIKDWYRLCHHRIKKNILNHFMPAGYPTTIDKGYSQFAISSFFASFSGTSLMILSTHSLLLAVGVGSSTSAPAAAALNWVMKDGVGQLGGILFASNIGTGHSLLGSSFDSDPKRWRMISAIMLDISIFLEVLSPLFPAFFLPIASFANVLKNISFLTGSATCASIHQALSREGNLADVTAKVASQRIVASILGTLIGIPLSSYAEGHVPMIAAYFFILSASHQYFTYESLKSVTFDEINKQRMYLIMKFYFKEIKSFDSAMKCGVDSSNINPYSLAKQESFFPFQNPHDFHQWLKIGSELNVLCPKGVHEFWHLRHYCIGEQENYILNCCITQKDNNKFKVDTVWLTFLEDAKAEDIIRGYFHAYTLRKLAKTKSYDNAKYSYNLNHILISESHSTMNKQIGDFNFAVKKAGWKISSKGNLTHLVSGYQLQIERCANKNNLVRKSNV
mmetsp:Transcript_12/g.12  ORF Transcript_12/g.12 Transcript_12/m.12 type:complete len:450 (+) Transcript_12:298-1647(+)